MLLASFPSFAFGLPPGSLAAYNAAIAQSHADGTRWPPSGHAHHERSAAELLEEARLCAQWRPPVPPVAPWASGWLEPQSEWAKIA